MDYSGQDWKPVVFKKAAPKTDAEAKRRGLKTGAQAKTHHQANRGSTQDGQRLAKIAREEVGSHARVGKATGKAITQARVAKGMNQKALAQAINQKPEVVAQYEQGKAMPNPQVLSKMTRVLGVHLTGKRLGDAL